MVEGRYGVAFSPLTHSIVSLTQTRVREKVSPRRLWIVSKRDIDNTLIDEWVPKVPADFRELAKLVRAVGAVVPIASGRPDSLDVLAIIIVTATGATDTARFHAPSAAAAVDSITVRLLANENFRRSAALPR